MNEKKNLLRLGACIVLFMVLFGGFVWLADPFFQYHAPMFRIPIILDNAVYQTAGAARNLEYDSAIVGTSMTENIHTSWLDEELGWHTMKLCYAGARTNDLKAILEQVERKDGALNNLIIDLNDYQLTSDSESSYAQRPEYLYDTHFYNDYEYLWNHDTFVLSMRRYLDGIRGVEDNVDSAYVWEDAELFGRDIAQSTCKDLREMLIKQRTEELGETEVYSVTGQTSDDLEEKLLLCQDNLDNLLPFIETHPETTVYLLIPPYSMLYWEQKVLLGELENMLAIYEYSIEKFLQYDNVRVFYFQYEPEIITNLDNYRDNAHHKPEFNRYMIDCMIKNEKRLTRDNYQEKIREMYEFAKDYPYENMWNN